VIADLVSAGLAAVEDVEWRVTAKHKTKIHHD
jgi:hypothetical protein